MLEEDTYNNCSYWNNGTSVVISVLLLSGDLPFTRKAYNQLNQSIFSRDAVFSMCLCVSALESLPSKMLGLLLPIHSCTCDIKTVNRKRKTGGFKKKDHLMMHLLIISLNKFWYGTRMTNKLYWDKEWSFLSKGMCQHWLVSCPRLCLFSL